MNTNELNHVSLLSHLWTSIAATVMLAIICCGIYPALIWAISQAAFPVQANGSLVKKNGSFTTDDTQAVGSALIGQNFSSVQYFHPRPSAAGNGYDATSSGGSNLGPLSQKWIDTIRQRALSYRAENHLLANTLIPTDAVTASGSGLDPHISPSNARLQASRVAEARKISVAQVQALISAHTDGPDLGILGDPGVNVLMLNLALDAKYPLPANQ